MKYIYGLILTLCLGMVSASAQASVAPKLIYEVQPAEKNGEAALAISIKNTSDSSIFVRAVDAPWAVRDLFKVYFTTDLPKAEDPKTWEMGYSAGSNSLGAVKSQEIKPNGELRESIPITWWYPEIGKVRGKSPVYLNWNFRLRVYTKDPDVKAANRSQPIDLDRVGGFLTLPKKG